jgi:tetratricopeptide (TPR) repeat protein
MAILVAGALCAQSGSVDLLAQARAAFEKRADPAQAHAGIDLYRQAAEADQSSYEARWEGARLCYYHGTYTFTGDKTQKLALFQDGIDRAKAAVALKPNSVEGHFWLGVLYAVYGETKGIFKSLHMVPDVKREMNAALALDPAFEGFGPDRVLGRVFYKLPGIAGGDNKLSLQHLEHALAGAPTNALTRLYLADTYRSEGMKPKAIEQLRFIIEMTPDPRWTPEQPWIKAQAEAMLRKLQ